MIEVCAVCAAELDDEPEEQRVGAGTMLFHLRCVPGCRFCARPYSPREAGWDFRGGVAWSDDWGYLPRLESAACPSCTDDAERRDYGPGW